MAIETDPDLDPSGTRRAVVGGGERCDHPPDARSYLGQMGLASFYRCGVCGGAVVVW